MTSNVSWDRSHGQRWGGGLVLGSVSLLGGDGQVVLSCGEVDVSPPKKVSPQKHR